MSRSFSLFQTSVGFIILLFECFIALIGLFWPRVDPQYYNYYISHKGACWLNAQQYDNSLPVPVRGQEIAFSTMSVMSRCTVLGLGWSAAEDFGVWSDSRLATIYVPIGPGQQKVTLKVIAFAQGPSQRVDVYVENKLIGGYDIKTQGRTYLTINVPKQSPKILSITFHIFDPISPALLGLGSDKRPLGIGLISLRWD